MEGRFRRLPILTISHAAPAKTLGDFDWSTNGYQPPDLGADLPCATFTNTYHRGEGLGIDLSVAGIGHQVAGWATVIRVDNVENGPHTQNRVDTMVVGIEKIFQIQKGRSACRLKPMVADLVGQ